ncbi:serine/threonine protein kinase [archaeon]|jgi:serine/threonine protein kinase|nr:serine/threonine protein kinase [archaeon]MBT3450839.1 serine/threonine protein kinase [archaeon]MBT6868452.1 serine/threonine protein kinase [archaeon]MBT7193551.1 serine/threonine protein kinase [archaeon]MBT7381254.1 serine/threonine protein kinase [archaeon]
MSTNQPLKIHIGRSRANDNNKQQEQISNQNPTTIAQQSVRSLDEQLKNPTHQELSVLLKIPRNQIRNISDFQIIERLGRGTYSRVYKALNPEQNIVAIKEYNFALTLNQFDEEKEAFQREAALFRDLGYHEQIPTCIAIAARISEHTGDFIEYNPSIVMEHVTGKTLAERIALKEGFTPEQIRNLIEQSRSPLNALHHGNSQPRFHRDIKPANLKLNDSGLLYILDFGSVRDTLIGTFGGTMGKGSLGYVHKEQFSGNPSFRTDLYSLGRTLYAAAIGKEMNPYEEFSQEKLDQTNLDHNTKEIIEILCREDLSGPQNIAELSELINPIPNEVRGEESTELEVAGEREIDKEKLSRKRLQIGLIDLLLKPNQISQIRSLNYISALGSTYVALRIYQNTQSSLLAGLTLLAPFGFSLANYYLIRSDKKKINQRDYEIRQLENEMDQISQGTLVQGEGLEWHENELKKSKRTSLLDPIHALSTSISTVSNLINVISYLKGDFTILLGSLAVSGITTPIAAYLTNKGIKDIYNIKKSSEAIAIINEQDSKIKVARRKAFDLKFDKYTHKHEEQGLGYFVRRKLRKKRKIERKKLITKIQSIDQQREDQGIAEYLHESNAIRAKELEEELSEEKNELTQIIKEESNKFEPLQRELARASRVHRKKKSFYFRRTTTSKKGKQLFNSQGSEQTSNGEPLYLGALTHEPKVEDIETAINLINFFYDKYSKSKDSAILTLQKISRRDDYSVTIKKIKRDIKELKSTGIRINDLESTINNVEKKRINLGITKPRFDHQKLLRDNARNRNLYLSDQIRKMSLRGSRKEDFDHSINELRELYKSFQNEEKIDIDQFEWLWEFNNVKLADYNSLDEKVEAYIGLVDMFDESPEHAKSIYRKAIYLAKDGYRYGCWGFSDTFEELKQKFDLDIPIGINQLIESIYKEVIFETVPKILDEHYLKKRNDHEWYPDIEIKEMKRYVNDIVENIESASNEHVNYWSNYWNEKYHDFIKNERHPEVIKATHQLNEIYHIRKLGLLVQEMNEANKAMN